MTSTNFYKQKTKDFLESTRKIKRFSCKTSTPLKRDLIFLKMVVDGSLSISLFTKKEETNSI